MFRNVRMAYRLSCVCASVHFAHMANNEDVPSFVSVPLKPIETEAYAFHGGRTSRGSLHGDGGGTVAMQVDHGDATGGSSGSGHQEERTWTEEMDDYDQRTEEIRSAHQDVGHGSHDDGHGPFAMPVPVCAPGVVPVVRNSRLKSGVVIWRLTVAGKRIMQVNEHPGQHDVVDRMFQELLAACRDGKNLYYLHRIRHKYRGEMNRAKKAADSD